MSPKRKVMTILASVAGSVLALGAVLAVPGGMDRHHAGGGRDGGFGEFGFGRGITRALASLDLSDDQKEKVKAILSDEEPRITPLIDDQLSSKKAVFEAVHSGTFDEKAVRAASAKNAKATTELAVERARIMSRFRDVLTDQQQTRLDEIQKEFEARLEKRIGMARSNWKEHAADFIDAL